MKKICIVAPDCFPVPAVRGGAVETVINNFIDENEKNKKLDIVCLSVYDKQAYLQSVIYKNTKFIYYKMPKFKITKFLIKACNYIGRKITGKNLKYDIHSKRLYDKIKKIKFDYLIVEGGDAISYELLTDKYDKKKIALHMHGVDITGKYNEKLSKMYGKYIALNEFTKSIISKENIIKNEDVYIVPNGLDFKRFNNKINLNEVLKIKEKYDIKEEEKVILFCGRLIPEKGVKEIIQSLKNVSSNEKFKLVIVGNSAFGNNAKTYYEKEILEISKEFSDKIIFTGFIHNKELYKMYQIADIFVAPSICEEAFGIVFLEAMASGLPIISTTSGGIPELVTRDAGILLDRDENLVRNLSISISKLLNDKELRTKMGENGMKISEQYDLEKVYECFVNVLNEMDGK